MKQKFQRGSRVRIAKDLGQSMSHFYKDCEAIVEYTYDQKYGHGDIKNYSLVILDQLGIPINTCSWYDESQLTLVNEHFTEGLAIMEKYFYK